MERKAGLRAIQFRHVEPNPATTGRLLSKSPRLEIFQGLKLPLDTALFDIEIRSRPTDQTTRDGERSVCTDILFRWNWGVPDGVGVDDVQALEDEVYRGKEDERRRMKKERLVEDRNRVRGRVPSVGMGLRRLSTLGAHGAW